jgi:DNA-binding transcriptional ArsR family regulator
MTWRIHFTAEDMARIQVSPTFGPLTETVFAVHLLRCPMQPRSLFSQWRGQVKGQLTTQVKALTDLMPPGSRGVDLCILTGAAPTIEQGVQALMAMKREHVLVEIEYVAADHKLPDAAWAVADADGSARHELAAATHTAHRALVEPYWTRIQACLHADQVARSRTLAHGGPERLLASLQGQLIRWRPPVLEVLMQGEMDLYLAGRGLALVPSLFVGAFPSLHTNPNDASAAPVLILPAAGEQARQGDLWNGSQARGTKGRGLAALVGRNRAAVLSAVAEGCSTTELAGRVGISLAAASQHASILRDAGLIITRRQGSAVLHVLTPLGAELLQAG